MLVKGIHPTMKKHTLPHYFFFLNAIYFLDFYIKNNNKKLFFNQKYIAKITNPIANLQFLTIKKLTYTRMK